MPATRDGQTAEVTYDRVDAAQTAPLVDGQTMDEEVVGLAQ